MKRIHGRVEFNDEEEKEFYYRKSEELGYSSFKDFALSAMKKEIEESNFSLSMLENIAETACKLAQYLSEQEKFTAEQKQTLKVAELIYELSVNTDIMKNDPSNQIFIDDPLMLDAGEKPHFRYKHALTAGFNINDYLK